MVDVLPCGWISSCGVLHGNIRGDQSTTEYLQRWPQRGRTMLASRSKNQDLTSERSQNNLPAGTDRHTLRKYNPMESESFVPSLSPQVIFESSWPHMLLLFFLKKSDQKSSPLQRRFTSRTSFSSKNAASTALYRVFLFPGSGSWFLSRYSGLIFLLIYKGLKAATHFFRPALLQRVHMEPGMGNFFWTVEVIVLGWRSRPLGRFWLWPNPFKSAR